jgi:hypothetical protein
VQQGEMPAKIGKSMDYRAQQMIDFLDGVVGVVDANSYESLCLWRENQELAVPCSWVQNNSGLMETVGYVNGYPVCLSLLTTRISGWKILFIEVTSRMVDHEMVEKWLLENMPKSAFKKSSRYINRTNAMNFSNILPNQRHFTIQIG